MSKKVFYVNIGMGTGGNISLSQYITALKERYPDYEVSVMSPYADIFQATEAVTNVYTPNQAREFLFDAKADNAKIITTRLYDLSDFIYKRLNYEQAWDILFDNALKLNMKTQPATFTTQLNVLSKFPNIQQQVDAVKKEINDKGYDDFVIMQFYGGQTPLVQVPVGERQREDGSKEQFPDWSKVQYNGDNEPLQRHYPADLAARFIKLYQEKNPKTAVIMFQLPNEPRFENTFLFTIPYLAYYELAKLPECKGAICIDSCLHHLLSGITDTTVIWAHSLPENFGYAHQKNIIQDCRRDDIIYMSLLGPSANKVRYIKPEKLLEEITQAAVPASATAHAKQAE